MKLDSRDKLVLFALVFIAILFSCLFYLDLNRKIGIGDREVIGSIHFKNNIIQRKFEDEVIWERLSNNSPLTNRDTIRSESFSDAIIRLKDGTEINIDENSMFNLDLTGESPNLDFSQGSLQIKKGSSDDHHILITSGGQEINVKSGDVKLEKAEKQNLSLFVERGNTTIKDGDKVVKVTGGKKAEFKSTGLEIKKIPALLIAPSSQKLILSQSNETSILFQWKLEEEFSNPMIEISRSPNFQLTLIKEKVSGDQASFRLREGTYYWRILVTNKQTNAKDVSDTGKFFVSRDEPLKIESPEPGRVFNYVNIPPLISLRWNSIPTIKTYRIEISNDSQFQNITKNVNTDSNQISFDDLQEGKYFVRVIGVSAFSDTKEKESPSLSFSVQKLSSYPTLKWMRPGNGAEISNEEVSLGKAILIWDGNPEYNSYQLQIARDTSFKNNVLNEVVSSNFYTINSGILNEGIYNVRILGKTQDGKTSEWSEILSFKITNQKTKVEEKDISTSETYLEILSPSSRIVQMKGKSSLDFEWKASNDFDRFDLVIYQHNGEKKTAIYKSSTKTNKYKLTNLSILDEGSFSWDLTGIKNGTSVLLRKGNFILALDQLKSLKPNDIEFISPKRIYR